jgi:hypothetical protein
MYKPANFNEFAVLIHGNNAVRISQTTDAAMGCIVVPDAGLYYPVL